MGGKSNAKVAVQTMEMMDDVNSPRAIEYIGRALVPQQFSIHIFTDTDVYLVDPQTKERRLLFAYRRSLIPAVSEWSSMLTRCFDTSILVSDRRFRASGAIKKRVPVRSGVIGYYDRLTPQQKSALGQVLKRKVHMAGRATAFTRHFPDRWSECLPFLRLLSVLYRRVCPEHYRRQSAFLKTIEKEMRIPQSVFTTVTVNENWATHTHTDKGDFPDGMSCLAVMGQNFTGGGLGFPRRGVLVHMKPGDVIFMNAHEPHGNTPMAIGQDGKRLSMVCYVRTDLAKFHQPVKLPDGSLYYV